MKHIKRVRIIRRADGYYCQFGVQTDRVIEHIPSGEVVGIDVGRTAYYTDSEGRTIANPRQYRKAEKRRKRLHKRLSRTQKQSNNRKKARRKVAKGYLKVQRQREDVARKQTNVLVSSHDVIAFEDLKIANMVKNRHLAKSISDAAWGTFLHGVRYYAMLHDIPWVAVTPQFTSQDCSACGITVKKSRSRRTHICTGCGVALDRDQNAAINILAKAESTVGQTGTDAPQRA